MSKELKRCPFCGNAAKTNHDWGNEVWGQRWCTGCKKCDVFFTFTGSSSWDINKKEDKEAENKSIEKWNTRVGDNV